MQISNNVSVCYHGNCSELHKSCQFPSLMWIAFRTPLILNMNNSYNNYNVLFSFKLDFLCTNTYVDTDTLGKPITFFQNKSILSIYIISNIFCGAKDLICMCQLGNS